MRWPGLVIIAACGRVGFAPLDDATPGSGDGPAAGNFCATVAMPLVCSDFEEGLPIEAGWTKTIIQGNGAIALSSSGSMSAHAITAAYPDQASVDDLSVAYLEYQGPALAHHATFAFDLLLPARPVDKDYEICNVELQVGTAIFANDLDIAAGGSDNYREEYFPTGTSGMFMTHLTPFPALTIHTWHRVAIDLDFIAQTYSFEVDQAVISAGPTAFPVAPGSTRFEGGLDFAAGVITGSSFQLDNLVIFAQ